MDDVRLLLLQYPFQPLPSALRPDSSYGKINSIHVSNAFVVLYELYNFVFIITQKSLLGGENSIFPTSLLIEIVNDEDFGCVHRGACEWKRSITEQWTQSTHRYWSKRRVIRSS